MAEKTPLLFIKDDPVIATLDQEAKEKKAHVEERARFLNKQADDLRDEIKVLGKSFWDQIEKRLIEIGKMPDGASMKTHSFSVENGVLFYCGKDGGDDHHPIHLLAELFKGLLK